ncbi:MAG TPA: PEP-CTERM sorting domain-containing protein, partial [Verrucomicrobiae bacterium]|nr:PEP-CTERM sorting domain-containing protein [Verrucomicrobiae bacterium]
SIGSIPGFFTITSTAPELVPAHQQIYLVAFNAPTSSAATEVLFLTYPNWGKPGFPGSSDIPNTTSFEVEAMVNNPGTAGNALMPGAQVWGSFSRNPSGLTFDETTGWSYLTFVVPEPSTFSLVSLTLIGVLAIRCLRMTDSFKSD